MAKPPPPTSTSDPALPTTATTTSSAPKSSSRPSPRPRGLLDPLAASARSLLASARRSPVTTLAAAFFLLALVMYGEDARTIAELSIDDYLYPDADLYNVSGLPPLALPPLTCDLSSGRWVFDNVSVPAYREKDCTFLTKQVSCLANGRPDDMWQYWRWQPNECSLPTYVFLLLLQIASSMLSCVIRLIGKAGSTLGDSWRRCAGSGSCSWGTR
jgi:hypothetical protein